MASDLLSARETCQLLGISQATLYAYVSRGLLESRPGPDHRSRAYPRPDVEKLLQRKREGRGAARGAAQSLDRVEASGNLATLSRFLYEIEKSPMALKLDSVEITARDKDGQQLALGLQVSGLVLNSPEGMK